MRALILMIQFLTRYPIPWEVPFTAQNFVRGMKWLPLVGLFTALPAALAMVLVNGLLGRELGALAAVILLVMVTGGLHLDGLGDSADGLFSYRSREEMLVIMRDSTLGVNGVIAVVLALLTEFVLLCRLPEIALLPALLCAPILGRFAAVWHSAMAPYARSTPGLGEYVNRTGLSQALGASLCSNLLVGGVLFACKTLPVLSVLPLTLLLHVLVALPAIGFAASLKRTLGGITGDTIGATIALLEQASLFFFLLIWTYMP